MIRPILAFLLFAAIGVSILYIEGPAIWHDMRVSKAALVPARDLKVEEAKCTAHWWIVSSCSISYRAPQMNKQSLRFTVLGTLGGERFQLMRAPDNYVTTDIGVDKLMNRIIMAILFGLTMFAMCTVSALKAIAAA